MKMTKKQLRWIIASNVMWSVFGLFVGIVVDYIYGNAAFLFVLAVAFVLGVCVVVNVFMFSASVRETNKDKQGFTAETKDRHERFRPYQKSDSFGGSRYSPDGVRNGREGYK